VKGVLLIAAVEDSIMLDEARMIVSVISVVIVLVVVLGEELLVKIPPADEVSEMPHGYVL
jgi:hypothetical protein